MRGHRYTSAAALVAVLTTLTAGVVTASPAWAAPPPITSAFDSGVDGWSEIGFVESCSEAPPTQAATWDASTGNPAGSLRVPDHFGETGVTAPAAYLGDKSAYAGGTLEYDIVIRFTDEAIYGDTILRSGATCLVWVPTTFPPLDTLEHRTVPLAASGASGTWHVGSFGGPAATDDDLVAVLGALTGIDIRTEWKTGPDDTTIDNVKLQNGVASGSTIAFEKAALSKAENLTSVNVRVSRTGDLSNAASVDFATADVKAKAGLDYTATSGTLTWAAGVGGFRTITIPITNDSLDEATETFTVSLSNVVGAGLGTPVLTVVKITDDDAPPSVAFTTTSRSVNEGTGTPGTAKFTVTLSAASGIRVTVPFHVEFVTAAADDLDSVTPAQLVFNAGVTSKNIVVTIDGDSTNEANETLLLHLDTPTNATLGAPDTAQLIIRNDDPAAT